MELAAVLDSDSSYKVSISGSWGVPWPDGDRGQKAFGAANLGSWFCSVMPAHSGVSGTIRPWRNRVEMGLVLDKRELVGPVEGNPSLPIPAEGAHSESLVLKVHGESLHEMGGGWESKLPSDRGDRLSGLSGGCGVGIEKNRGSSGGLEIAEQRGGADTYNGIGSSTSNTVFGASEKAFESCGHGEEVQEKAERNLGGIGSVQSDVRVNKVVEQNQAQEKAEVVIATDEQRLPEAVRFGWKFWCLVSDDESDLEEEKQCTVSEPALSPPIIREVAENILEEGGWSAPVCRRKKELQSRRTKRRLPIVVDGRWQRPVRRWIDLGDSAWKHCPPAKSNSGSACLQAKLRDGGPARFFRKEMMADKAEKVV
jgi:hypothetical protein